jgi:hypothetical protein
MTIQINRWATWPSAGTGKKRAKAQEHADALIASCIAVEQVIAALAAGKITAPDVSGVAERDIRYAPYFSARRGRNERSTVPYSIKWIESVLIADSKPSRWIRVAMQLLEGRERGYVDQYVFDAIANLRPGYNSTQLARRLRLKEKEYETLHGAEIAMGVDPK